MSTEPPETAQPTSTTPEALYAVWVAARLHGVSSSRFPAFTRERLGRELTYREVWDAAGELQAHSRWRGAVGRPRSRPAEPPAPPQAETRAAMQGWIVVDEPRLGLRRVLYRLPNDGMPRPELLQALDELVGVRQVIEITHDREILIVALVEDLDEAENLRARIQDHAVGQPVKLDVISFESHDAAQATWIAHARRRLGLDQPAT